MKKRVLLGVLLACAMCGLVATAFAGSSKQR